jgi:hypothetical protein
VHGKYELNSSSTPAIVVALTPVQSIFALDLALSRLVAGDGDRHLQESG